MRKFNQDGALLIWTPGGVWLQTQEEGLRRSSYCGKLSVSSVEAFAALHLIPLEVRLGERASGADSRHVSRPGRERLSMSRPD